MPWITLADYEYWMVCPEEGKIVFNRKLYTNTWYTSKDSRNPARSSRQAFQEIDWSHTGARITLGPAQSSMLTHCLVTAFLQLERKSGPSFSKPELAPHSLPWGEGSQNKVQQT